LKPSDVNPRVLVTRPKHQQSSFLSRCEQAGFQTLSLPCIDILPVESDLSAEHVNNASLVIFTSRNAVDFAHTLLPLPWPNTSIYAIGRATERALTKIDQSVVAPPAEPYNSEAFLKWHSSQSGLDSVLLIKGEGGRDLIETTLRTKNIRVEVKAVYKRVRPIVSDAERQRVFANEPPDIISVTSDDVLRNLVNIAGPEYTSVLHSTQLIVNSQRCADTATRLGFDHQPIVATPPGDDGQLSAISAWASSDETS